MVLLRNGSWRRERPDVYIGKGRLFAAGRIGRIGRDGNAPIGGTAVGRTARFPESAEQSSQSIRHDAPFA